MTKEERSAYNKKRYEALKAKNPITRKIGKTQSQRSKEYRESHPEIIIARRKQYNDLVRMKINFYNAYQKQNMFEIEYYI